MKLFVKPSEARNMPIRASPTNMGSKNLKYAMKLLPAYTVGTTHKAASG